MKLTRVEALAMARAYTLAHLWQYQKLHEAGEVRTDEDGNSPAEQLAQVEDTCEAVIRELEELIAEEKALPQDGYREAREIIGGCVTFLARYRGGETSFDPHERALILRVKSWLAAHPPGDTAEENT